MIITVTPNPSVDRTATVPGLLRGEVNRATHSRIDPGGKGVNVSRALAAHAADTIAVIPSGGPEGHLLDELLAEAGIDVLAIPITGPVRLNVALVEPDGTTTKVNEPGPHLSSDELAALLAGAAGTLAAGPDWLVGCGSLPPGVEPSFYAGLVELCRDAGVRIGIDTSGAPLAHAVAAGPDLIKPNLEELEELVGARLPTLKDVSSAATDLVSGGVATVLVSLGRHGALLTSREVSAHAQAVVARPLSTVGAGDSLLAGYLHATSRGASATEALSAGVAWGAAAVSLPGSRMPSPADVAGIPVSITTQPHLTLTVAD